MDIDNLDEYQLFELLQEKPEFVDEVDISKVKTGWYIAVLVSKYPQLYDRADIDSLEAIPLSFLLRHQPQFFDRIDPKRLSQSGEAVSQLLQDQPQFFKVMGPYLTVMNSEEISNVLASQPQFFDHFKHNSFSEDDLCHMCSESDELKQKFLERINEYGDEVVRALLDI